MSDQDVRQALDGAEEMSAAESAGYGVRHAGPCPVRALGHRGGVYWYLSPAGELRTLEGAKHNKLGIASLFEGDVEWLRRAFPSFDKDGNPKPGTWSPDAAACYLMRACCAEGLFDATLPVRSLGVWRGRDGAPVVHCGDRVNLGGEWVESGRKEVDALYPAASRIARPADQPASRDTGRKILEDIRELWTFEDPVGADMVMGWAGAALLGAFPTWRAHIYVNGERGSGKSWLADMVSAMLGAQAHGAMNNFTEGGLRQALTGEARAMVLDEAEHDEGNRVEKVIELLRHMSSGEGVKAVRGSPGGTSQSFTVTGCAYLSSILHVPLKPMDRSRIAVVRLGQLASGADAVGRAERAREAIRHAADASSALRARAVQRSSLFLDLVDVYRRAFMERGCDARQSDQFATLLAGRDLLTQDDAPTGEALTAEVDAFAHLIDQAKSDDLEDSEGALCLGHLYSSVVDLWRSGERQTVSQVIMNACQDAGVDARRALGTIGLKVEQPPGGGIDGARLLVANTHQGLSRIFAGTRWERGAWAQALRYLPGAAAATTPPRFAGVRSRATVLPSDVLPREDDQRDTPEAA